MKTMVYPSLPSLLNLCGTRIAYLMWTRHGLFKWCSKEDLFENYVDIVLDDVQSLPVPETMKPLILKYVKPAGKHLISFLDLWFSKTQSHNSQKWLTEEMLIECLILNADGLINYRKTAKELLSSRMLHNVFAFRLACINFLEKEVLKLWPFVKKYYLNKIMLESEKSDAYLDQLSIWKSIELAQRAKRHCIEDFNIPYFEILGTLVHSPLLPCTAECDEVLFWISYLVSKENAINMKEIPHFKGKSADWYKYSLQSAVVSGNAACFDYFYSLRNTGIEYNCVKMFEQFFSSKKEDRQQPCFVFHFVLLNYEEKAELFRKFPREMVSHFLQWPLSLTFVEKTEELWNLIPDEHKNWVIVKIFAILFHKNTMVLPFRYNFHEYRVFGLRHPYTIAGIHSVDHLENIWVDLWKISLDSYKSPVFDYFIFPSIMKFGGNEEFLTYFLTSGLKEKLIHLFLTNGEAILELYAGTNMEDSLQSLIAKYIPEGFGDGDRRYIPVRLDYIAEIGATLPQEPRYIPLNLPKHVHENFVNYIKAFLFSSDTIDKSLFYY
ncbi:hypothetical protein AVEN_261960-1 [Araneus ventricosus]|uniref:Uncharacterized protein n=1 Tax=Araneus ventricosus TaxID=182803 RepID=A0A4Y2EPV2_ARAVE|nr:hypothetical protein AVEN_261960-1 [Araneus ventricosus]